MENDRNGDVPREVEQEPRTTEDGSQSKHRSYSLFYL